MLFSLLFLIGLVRSADYEIVDFYRNQKQGKLSNVERERQKFEDWHVNYPSKIRFATQSIVTVLQAEPVQLETCRIGDMIGLWWNKCVTPCLSYLRLNANRVLRVSGCHGFYGFCEANLTLSWDETRDKLVRSRVPSEGRQNEAVQSRSFQLIRSDSFETFAWYFVSLSREFKEQIWKGIIFFYWRCILRRDPRCKAEKDFRPRLPVHENLWNSRSPRKKWTDRFETAREQ
jgi:hypothetical protein